MACLDCDGQHPQERLIVEGVCRCCELVDKDTSNKRTRYCKVCSAYICENCRDDIAKRTKAFVTDKVEKIADAIKSITKKGRGRKKKTGDEVVRPMEFEKAEPKQIEFPTEEFDETETPT